MASEGIDAMLPAGELPNFRAPRAEFEVEDYGSYPETQDEGQYQMNDTVTNFISYFHRHVVEQNIYDIQDIYDTTWHKLTERYFKNSPWPPVSAISPLVQGDSAFLNLYQELYYRHMYAKLKPTLEDRVASWTNYMALFSLVLDPEIQLEERISLPSSWLWDMVDEFVYQYQSFVHYRGKVKTKTEDEISMLQDCEQVWDTLAVQKILHDLVTKSKIVEHLHKLDAQGKSSQGEDLNLLQMLGYYSVIGLLRVHCLLGDYRLALKQLDPIDISKRGLLGRVTACHITTYYYMGFAYMMSRRYMDSIKALSNILLYLNRTKQYHTRSASYDIIVKKNEQMFALLSILVSLSPYHLDENLQTLLREKYNEKIQRMLRGETAVHEETFLFACPKFCIPHPPNYADQGAEDLHTTATRLQCDLFMNTVKQSVAHTTIRSYLKLYTTIPTAKLANFLGWTEEEFTRNVLSLKHKSTEQVWNGGSATDGVFTTGSDVDFYIEGEMVHVAESKVVRKFSDYFIRHINKFEEIITDLHTSRNLATCE
jgi:translation initiation factor 3 subunit L